uniref:SAM domain-containing protein n=1 Tax=Amphiprion ocellaris TaxID=80972 RepID=A0AAQ6AH40_AMPOC
MYLLYIPLLHYIHSVSFCVLSPSVPGPRAGCWMLQMCGCVLWSLCPTPHLSIATPLSVSLYLYLYPSISTPLSVSLYLYPSISISLPLLSLSTLSVKKRSWSWQQYLNEQKAEAAPPTLFTQSQSFPSRRTGFRLGMKLEGVDPLHPSMFCVLTVAEVIGCRLRLHIDGYSECYDFWVNADSADIRPAGWCKEHGNKLHPPRGEQTSTGSVIFSPQALMLLRPPCSPVSLQSVYTCLSVHLSVFYTCLSVCLSYHLTLVRCSAGHPNPEGFVWEEYLQETGSTAAPSSAFTLRDPHGFQVNHRLEAVDRRNPMLIRVATVADTEDYRVKVHYDGWSTQFDVWCDSDLPDLHPVGWCQRSGHPLEPPPGQTDRLERQTVMFSLHLNLLCLSAFGCPYSDINMRKEVVLPDRLGGERVVTLVPVVMHYHAEPSLQAALHQSVFLSALSAQPGRDLSLCWEQHRKLLPAVAGVHAHSVQHWSVQQVSDFIESLPGCEEQAKQFRDEQIDGRSFLLLTQRDIVRIMSIKLGPALKIYNSILMFKHAKDGSQSHGEDGSQSHGKDT